MYRGGGGGVGDNNDTSHYVLSLSWVLSFIQKHSYKNSIIIKVRVKMLDFCPPNFFCIHEFSPMSTFIHL